MPPGSRDGCLRGAWPGIMLEFYVLVTSCLMLCPEHLRHDVANLWLARFNVVDDLSSCAPQEFQAVQPTSVAKPETRFHISP